jgi:Photosynthetic reaction centre cytochrome C subunit
MKISRKSLFIIALCGAMVIAQGFTPKHDDDKPVNLKILPKNISEEDLHKVMRNFSMSLGVRCGFCHVSEKVEGQERPKFDFASDNKPEKNIARKMMMMVSAINEKYIGQMIGGDHTLEQINCVTCHMGRKTPIITVDSLKKPEGK